jgi:hypothetical protein
MCFIHNRKLHRLHLCIYDSLSSLQASNYQQSEHMQALRLSDMTRNMLHVRALKCAMFFPESKAWTFFACTKETDFNFVVGIRVSSS